MVSFCAPNNTRPSSSVLLVFLSLLRIAPSLVIYFSSLLLVFRFCRLATPSSSSLSLLAPLLHHGHLARPLNAPRPRVGPANDTDAPLLRLRRRQLRRLSRLGPVGRDRLRARVPAQIGRLRPVPLPDAHLRALDVQNGHVVSRRRCLHHDAGLRVGVEQRRVHGERERERGQ